MNRTLLNLHFLTVLFLALFTQILAQNAPIKSPDEDAAQTVTAGQNSPQQITPFRFNFSEAERETLFWNLIKNGSNASDFRLFLEQFPNSAFATTAASKLKIAEENSKAKETPKSTVSDLETSICQKPCAKLENTKAVREGLYQGYFLPNYKGFDSQREVAYKAAQDYLYNCASDDDEIVKYLKKWIDRNYAPCHFGSYIDTKRFNKAVLEHNAAETFAAGKILLDREPDFLTIMLFMVDAGYLQTYLKQDNKLNDETIFYAQQSINKIKVEKIQEEILYKPFDNKNDALAWLNYDIAFIYHFRKQDTQSAVPYFYQATKCQSANLSISHIPFTILGEWYLDQYNQAVSEYNVVKANPRISQSIKDELARKWQILADRALEVYSHSYIVLRRRLHTPKFIEKIEPVLIKLYRLRQNVDLSQLDAFAASISEKPITDPATVIGP